MKHTTKPLVLASRSPRRVELLGQLGLMPVVVPADIDESRRVGESPAQYVNRVALEKAGAVAAQVGHDAVVLGADTAVVARGEIFGKPSDYVAARRMLSRLAGTTHHVLSAVAVVCQGVSWTAISDTAVTFRSLTEAEMEWYWNTGEPRDKAGAYGIQGYGAIFIERIEGSYSGVMGLPLFEAMTLLEKCGITLNQST